MKSYKHPVISKEAIKDVVSILKSGKLSGYRGTPEGQLGGRWVQELESAFRDYFGVKYAIAMSSATACLHIALLTLGIGKGDEVIVSPTSFSASASCVLLAGATPVFADIQDDIFCIDPKEIKKAITPRTKAIIPVHLMGHPADMYSILFLARKHSLLVIEDSAQALGSLCYCQFTGAMGDCGIFSFNQSKPVSTGEGGMLVTDNAHIAQRAIALRNHAEVSDPGLSVAGYNYRLCEVEACLALHQFRRLDEINNTRIELTSYLTEELSKIEGLTPPVTHPNCKHTFYTYGVKFGIVGMSRDEFQDRMMGNGVYFGIKGYGRPLYRLPAFGAKGNLCPVAEQMYRELVVTDICKPPATIKDMKEVVKAIKKTIP